MVKASCDAWSTSKAATMVLEQNGVNESSPLLPARTNDAIEALTPLDQPIQSPNSRSDQCLANETVDEGHRQETKSSLYLFLLTLCLSGLQIVWSVELSNGSPYLLSLGISKSLLAFVWIAGPLSGTLAQPYVGLKSDRCRSRFGKRRPFMVGGAIATVFSLLVLAWTKEIVGVVWYAVFRLSDAKPDEDGVTRASIVLAILMIYILDFSINIIQAGIRAFIVDNAPAHQQDLANAWASRMSGVGNIVGYLFGYVDLPKYVWFFGDTQFKALCALASVVMLITLAISCSNITERDARLEERPVKQHGVLSVLKQLYLSVWKLPKQIKAICLVQFFAWIGWFPFLFYITTYIGEIYVGPIFSANPDMTEEEINTVWQRATRIGTFALFTFAITTFVASVFLPSFVAKSCKGPEATVRTSMLESPNSPRPIAHDGQYSPAHNEYNYCHYYICKIVSYRSSLVTKHLTLRRAWLLSHLIFATLMWFTFLVNTTAGATILVSLVGFPWAITNWIPFALMAVKIRTSDTRFQGLAASPRSRDIRGGRRISTDEDLSEGADQAGVVLGIHNVAIAAPQVIATLVSSAIFQALQKPRGYIGDESVAWVLRLGGVAALIAACLTGRVEE